MIERFKLPKEVYDEVRLLVDEYMDNIIDSVQDKFKVYEDNGTDFTAMIITGLMVKIMKFIEDELNEDHYYHILNQVNKTFNQNDLNLTLIKMGSEDETT